MKEPAFTVLSSPDVAEVADLGGFSITDLSEVGYIRHSWLRGLSLGRTALGNEEGRSGNNGRTTKVDARRRKDSGRC